MKQQLMATEYVTVVVIKDDVVDESFLFIGENSEIAQRAESKFLDLCRKRIVYFNEYAQDDIDAMLENGWTEFGNTGSICITWPTVVN